MMKRVLLAAALLLAAGRADAATILSACSEDISCIFQGTVSVDATSGHFDSSYARLSLKPTASAAAVPPPNRIQTNTFSAASADFWVSATYFNTGATAGSNAVWVEFSDAGTQRLLIRGTGTNQTYKLTKRTGGGSPTNTDLATATGTICAATTRCKLDIHVVYSSSGSVNVYNNGTLILSYSGDVTTDSATTLNQVDFAAEDNVNNSSWSEIIVSDSDTRSMRMVTCAPSAAGLPSSSWTGTASNINANTASDVTFNYTTTSNDFSNWQSGCTIPTSGTTSVIDVRSYGRLAIGASGPQNARFSFNESSTSYDNGADLSGITTSFTNLKYDWGATSPATSAAWTPSELNTIFGAGGFGVKSRP
jgi:hypothetical protein